MALELFLLLPRNVENRVCLDIFEHQMYKQIKGVTLFFQVTVVMLIPYRFRML